MFFELRILQNNICKKHKKQFSDANIALINLIYKELKKLQNAKRASKSISIIIQNQNYTDQNTTPFCSPFSKGEWDKILIRAHPLKKSPKLQFW